MDAETFSAELDALSPEGDGALGTPLRKLSHAAFVGLLKDALRNFNRPDLLSHSPLLRLRLLGADRSAGSAALQTLLTGALDTLFSGAPDEKLRRAIELSYLRPAPKQQVVAERLGLSFSTYRRYLARGIDRLARWLWDSEHKTVETTPRLSIVVLPFVNLGDAAESYLVDGITENLTTDLSRIADMLVIGRNTAFTFRDRAIDPRQLGPELGVRYVMEGSVQTADSRIRISARLVDAQSGAQLWAERFDRPRADVLDLQDEITAHLARTVDIQLSRAECQRSAGEREANLDSAELALRARALWNQPFSSARAREARRLFERALRLDADNVTALLGLADIHTRDVACYRAEDVGEQIRIADAAVSHALSLAPHSAHAHFCRGAVLCAMRAPERAKREFELAVSIDRNMANAHAYIGLMEVLLGRAERTEEHVTRALRLSPRDPLQDAWLVMAGIADLYLGRLERAVEYLQRAVAVNPDCGWSQMTFAAALALAGREQESAEACAVARRLAPNFTVSKYRSEALSSNRVYLKQRERYCVALRQLGVPERVAA